MPVRNWVAHFLPRNRRCRTRRRLSAFPLAAAERLECRNLLAGVLGLSINQPSETRLSFTSSADSNITNGVESFDVLPADGWTFSVVGGRKSINVSVRRNGAESYEPYWVFDLNPAVGQDLGPGSFIDASATHSDPGTDAALSFRSTNYWHYTSLTGEFSILEFDLNADGSVLRLSVDFRVQSDISGLPQTTTGKFRYHSTPIVGESAGPTATQLTVTRDGDLSQPQIVQLTSGLPQVAGVPAQATIPAGEASIVVPINVRDNQFANDSRRVTFLATAPGMQAATQNLIVQDDDGVPALEAIILQDQIAESAGAQAAMMLLSRNTETSGPMTVTLTNSDPTEIHIMATAVIPAGESSILIPIDAVDDTFLDGSRTVTVRASSGGLIRAVTSLRVTDDSSDEVPALTLEVSTNSVNESDGRRAAQLIIRHNVETTYAIRVDLTSSVPDRLVPMASQTDIPAGQRETRVDLSAIDDLIARSNVNVAIVAAFSPYQFTYPYPDSPALRSSSVVVHVTDNDVAAVDVSIDPLSSWLAFDSTPGSRVGQGFRNYHISTATGWVFSGSGDNRVLHLAAFETPPPGLHYSGDWVLDLAAPTGRTLIPGLFENAALFPFQNANRPGLGLSGNHRSNTTILGFFRILEAKYAASGAPELIHVSFTQFEDQNLSIWTKGELLYRRTPIDELYEGPSREPRTLTVRRNTPTNQPLVVTLHNSDPDLIEMPQTVTIPSGSSSATVPITIQDNHTLDELRTVSVSATANGHLPGEDSANLIDNDIAGLVAAGGFDNLARIDEGSQIDVPISLSAQPASNVVVNASLSSPGRVALNRQEFVFTPDNWSTPQVLTMSAADNPHWDGNTARTLSLSVVSDRSDSAFRSVNTLRRQFQVIDNEPAVPSLTASSKTLDGHPVLQWAAVPGALSYGIWIDNLTTGKVAIHRATSMVNSYRPEEPFTPGTYRVWIRVTMPVGVSPWGVARDFEVLPVPEWLNVPAAESQAETIRWSRIGDLTSYEVWINNRDTKTRAYFETGLASPETSLPVMLPTANYAAFVRAKSGNVWTDWSDRFLFTVLRAPVRNVTASVTNNTLNASWSAVTGATSYEMLVRDAAGTLVSRFANIGSTSYHGPASNGRRPLAAGVYGITVTAYSGASAITAPGPAKILYVTQAPDVHVTTAFAEWDAIPGASGYRFRVTKKGGASGAWIDTALTRVVFSPRLKPGRYIVEIQSLYPDGTVSSVAGSGLVRRIRN